MKNKRNSRFLFVLLFTAGSLFAGEPQQPVATVDATSQETVQKEHVQNSWDKVGALYLPSLISKEDKQKMLTSLSKLLEQPSNQGPVNQVTTTLAGLTPSERALLISESLFALS